MKWPHRHHWVQSPPGEHIVRNPWRNGRWIMELRECGCGELSARAIGFVPSSQLRLTH